MLCVFILFHLVAIFAQQDFAEACSSRPQLSIGEKHIKVHRGENVTIDCTAGPAASGNANTFLHWKKNEIGTSTDSNSTKTITLPDLHSAHYICDVERLSINSFTPADTGHYICTREPAQTTIPFILSAEINIEMFQPYAPIVEISPGPNLKFVEHEKYNLTCQVIGSPIPAIKWIVENKTVFTCYKDTCTIEVTAVNNTTYTCLALNDVGEESKSIHAAVLVPPKIHKSDFGHYGSTLTCIVNRSVPPPFFIWQYQNYNCRNKVENCAPGHLWNNISGSAYQVSSSKKGASFVNTLHILESGTNAYFQCIAFNEAGSDSDVMRVLLSKESKVSDGMDSSTLGGMVTAILIFCALVAVLVYMARKKMLMHKYARFLSPYSDYQFKPDVDLMSQGLHLPYDDAWEYPRNRLEFIKILGSGAFGQVWLARAVDIQNWSYNSESMERKRKTSLYDYVRKTNRNNNKMSYHAFVAVKTLKDDATESEYKDLASEIKVLIHIGKHKCIVNLLGACTRGGSLFSIMEYCPFGDLKNFLKSRRECFSPVWSVSLPNSVTDSFTFGDASTMVYQISKGMEFLHSKKLIHRDLACRNILLGEQYCIKISDFGLARDIYEDDNYVKTTSGLLPIKWMSPESLFDKIYNTKTDVWSFSIVMWEIFTLGGSPYPGIPVEDLFTYIHRGHRMRQPDSCPHQMYEIMTNCWSKVADERPTFTEIADMVESVLRVNITSNPYLQLFADDDSCSRVLEHESSSDSSSKRGNKKFSFAGLFGGFVPSKKNRPSAEDQLLSRLSSSNSDVFEKV